MGNLGRVFGIVGVDWEGIGVVDRFVGFLFFAETVEYDAAVDERDPETESRSFELVSR